VKRKFLPPLLILSLLSAAILLPPAARMQPSAARQAGGYHALVIGNNNYAALPRLKTAEADAREVAAILKEFYGFETRLLLNATRQQIVSALFSYRQTLKPDDNLLVYYAGHGINDKEADKAYWLPVDATRDDDSNWISADDITTRLRAIPARHVLVIADSCYSGTLTRGLGEALPPPNAREQFIQRMMAGRSRTLMASGGDEPVADGGGGRHSVFANALLKGLRGMDKGMFTAAELFRYHVEEPVAGRAQQTPEYNPLRNSGHESGDFVFVRVKIGDRTAEVKVELPTPKGTSAAPVDPAAIELSFWESIKASTDAEDFKAYLDQYPSGRFAALARNNLRRLEAAARPAPTPTVSNPPAPNTAANSTAARPSPGAVMRPRSGIELVYVPPGEFMMGSENGEADEKPAHRVTIREGVWMGKYEVTQGQWQQIMGATIRQRQAVRGTILRQQRDKTNPQFPIVGEGAEYPMYYINWNEAQEFIQRLNAQNDGFEYRLPSEAEWEYACRAGTLGDYSGKLDAVAWYGNNSGRQYLDAAEIWRADHNYFMRITENGGQTHPVGQKQANGFGLYDMHGNVCEWVQDYYHNSYAGAPSDGSAWLSGGDPNLRVMRGGSWYSPTALRSADRSRFDPMTRYYILGFRVVAVARQ
jgi:formylglycine-generating enzyme required for sulfatase activity/uncharacterized caspase-like protein